MMNRLSSAAIGQPFLAPSRGRRCFAGFALLAWVWLAVMVDGSPSVHSQAEVDRIVRYLETLSRDDGGYAWNGQAISHLTPTFFVVGAYQILGREPPEKARLAEWVWLNHPSSVRSFAQEHRHNDFQHLQTLSWLGEDIASLSERTAQLDAPYPYPKQYESHGYPSFEGEASVFPARSLLGLPPPPDAFFEYIESRRRANGSYNNTPAADGSDGNILNTWAGVSAWTTTGQPIDRRAALVAWVQDCQLESGGFTHQPNASIGGTDDVAYTWAAARTLALLDAEPKDRAGCIRYLHSLANADGGFADRPGWLSAPMATYYALDALAALGELPSLSNLERPVPSQAPALPEDLRVYSIQIESHGTGSPHDAALLADALKIDLWGAKNATPAWLTRAQQVADENGVATRFFVANEEYGTWVTVSGMGNYSHMSDLIAPAGSDFGPSLANKGDFEWEAFREKRIQPLEAARGRLVWQFGENGPLMRMVLDASLNGPGYAAISTFHFGNIDFTTSEPLLHRWRGQIPYIALQDAHGPEPWWFTDMTLGMRTLFLATEPTWEGWLKALENNWVVAVRHDERTGFQTWMHTGSDAVAEFVREREVKWRWWDSDRIQRPMVSVALVSSDDALETGKPEEGAALRIRCARRNGRHGQLLAPLAELVAVRIDGQQRPTQLVEVPGRRGPRLADRYHLVDVTELEPGWHSAVVALRHVETNELVDHRIEFQR